MTDNLEHSDAALAERAPVGWGFRLWWVLASTVGLAVGFAVAFAVLEAVGVAVAFAVLEAVGVAVGGALYGAITGGVLVWLLRQPAPRRGEATEA